MIEKLPPREREVFEALFAAGESSAADLQSRMAEPPSNSALRIMLSRLEKKGFVTHREVDGKFVYAPAVAERNLRQSVLRQMIGTFFGGSPAGAAAALIGMSEEIAPEELDRIEAAIAAARAGQGR
jgi:predicted transcriptional regulator